MEKEIELEGVRVAMEVTGSGRPLILMHGWGGVHSRACGTPFRRARSYPVRIPKQG